MAEWKDIENYKTGTIEGSEVRFGQFKLSVHRHRYYPKDIWLASCYGLFERRELASKELGEAKCQAKAWLQVIIENAVDEILGA